MSLNKKIKWECSKVNVKAIDNSYKTFSDACVGEMILIKRCHLGVCEIFGDRIRIFNLCGKYQEIKGVKNKKTFFKKLKAYEKSFKKKAGWYEIIPYIESPKDKVKK